jgi:regulator of nucleoside diphosphate kinase
MAKLPTIIITQEDRNKLALLVDAHATDSDNALIDSLDQEISRARIVKPGEIPPDVVTMNSRVVFRDDGSQTTQTVTLVYPGQENSVEGCISILTPVGAALLGLSEGQNISYATPDGRQKSLTLLKVLYQPESEGRTDL